MRIAIGELYNSDSNKRKILSAKHRVYRLLGYNPLLLAFKRTCAFCLNELTDDSVEGVWEQSSIFDFSKHIYIEEHQCSHCKQRWRYNRGFERGNYKFDEAIKKEMELFAPLREENKRRIDDMLKMQKRDK